MLPSSQQLAFNNMRGQPITGTTDCQSFLLCPMSAQDTTGIFFSDLSGSGAVGLSGVCLGL